MAWRCKPIDWASLSVADNHVPLRSCGKPMSAQDITARTSIIHPDLGNVARFNSRLAGARGRGVFKRTIASGLQRLQNIVGHFQSQGSGLGHQAKDGSPFFTEGAQVDLLNARQPRAGMQQVCGCISKQVASFKRFIRAHLVRLPAHVEPYQVARLAESHVVEGDERQLQSFHGDSVRPTIAEGGAADSPVVNSRRRVPGGPL